MREPDIQIESWGPFAEGRNDVFSNPLLSEIGAAHGKSVGQVVPPVVDPARRHRHTEVGTP